MKDFSQNEWGLVLAGGGGKGAYQIGAFKALWENNLQDYITAVSGTSVGALNAVLFAYGDENVARDVWSHITPKQFLEISPEMIDFKEGIVSRDGLLEIFDNYVNMEEIRTSDKAIYVAATEFDEYGTGQGEAKYFKLNYMPVDDMKKILLASSALPIIYSPVDIDGRMYRDGGLKDNLPIEPLYRDGIRHFIVIGLSTERRIDYERYPDAEFVYIKPSRDIGDFWDGTLDFTFKGAKVRMELGYLDAVRTLEYSDKNMDDPGVKQAYNIAVQSDCDRIIFDYKKADLEQKVNSDMDKINDLINKYM